MHNNTLTLKWVLPDGGASWFPASGVMALPSADTGIRHAQGVMGFIERVEFDNGDGTDVRCTIDRGTVYILNALGKTIDTIHLGMSSPRDSAGQAA